MTAMIRIRPMGEAWAFSVPSACFSMVVILPRHQPKVPPRIRPPARIAQARPSKAMCGIVGSMLVPQRARPIRGTMIAGMIHIRCGVRVRGLRLRRKISGRAMASPISGPRT